MICYEYPFNERIRTYLRLESLCARLAVLAKGHAPYDHHFALCTLFEIMEIGNRAELRTETLKELEKQKNILTAFRGNPAIDETTLNSVLEELEQSFQALSQTSWRMGGAPGENDWLMSVRNRTGIPGGTCSFDLPSYHAWINLPLNERQQHLALWMEIVTPLQKAVKVLMRLIRETGLAQKMVAITGHFQQYLTQGKPYQLARIELDETLGVVPEIAVNRMLITTRFVMFSVLERAAQTPQDITFELTLCN